MTIPIENLAHKRSRSVGLLHRAAILLLLLSSTVLAMEQVADTRFSIDRGFYEVATNLVISTETASSTISYTLDGSDPRTSTNAMSSPAPATIWIDPDSSSGKWQATPGVMVRAYAHKDGLQPSNVDTHTYIFTSAVRNQGDIRPGGSEVFWDSTEMDPDVINNPAYSDEVEAALLSIPTWSIVMDHEDLFGPEGIHRGDNLLEDWEMPCSLELIYPNQPAFSSFEGFQVDCGIKSQGGGARWNKGQTDHKQSFGMRFRRKYGAGQLTYPLFEHAPLNSDSECGDYDKIVLRAGHNKCYGHDFDLEHTVYARDQLARDLQIDMSGIGSHGSFVHLYLNGIYWGLYNPCERPDNAFAASYLGGNKEDYYCGKGKGGDTSGVDDRFDTWSNTVSRSSDISTLMDYCNIDNHADMTLFSIYAAIGDFPQYYYTVGNNPGGKVHFFNWDAEDAFGGGSLRSSDEPDWSNAIRCYGFFDMWDYNDEYKINFADRVYKACFNGGALTDEHVLENWNRLCDAIESAMVCESARWGDEKSSSPITRDNEWADAREAVASGTVGKSDWLVSILRDRMVYPSFNPPLFKEGSETIDVVSKVVPAGFELTLHPDDSPTGTIYYTTDGSDPRAVDGNPQGIDAGTGTTITINSTTCIKARTLDGGTWSALHEATFFVDQDLSGIKITEIMYNPQDAPMVSGAVVSSITGNAGSIDPAYTNRALLVFTETLPDALTGGDKVVLSGASNAANNGTFTIAEVIFEGSIGQIRTKKVLLSEALTDESASGITGDFLYDGDRYEFVEVKNTGANTLDLSGITFTRGINYTFPNGSKLASGQIAVLARNPWDFEDRYPGVTPAGVFPASTLDNGGERVEMALNAGVLYDVVSIAGNGVVISPEIPPQIGAGDRIQISLSGEYCNNEMFEIESVSGNTVFVKGLLASEGSGPKAHFFDVITSIEYNDRFPWPLSADGYGFSITPTNSNPVGNQDFAEVWRASAFANGSPGTDDPEPQEAVVLVNEVLTHTDDPLRDTIELYNPGLQAVDVGGWFLTDNRTVPQKWTIPEGSIIPADGYLTFYEGHYVSGTLVFADDEFGSAFSLSAAGDDIYLFSPPLGFSHGFSFEGAFNGVSFGRYVTSQNEEQFPAQLSFSPDSANAGPTIGPLVITELMYNPTETGHEFIELANISSSDVLLYDPSAPTNVWTMGGISFEFPETNSVLAAGQTLLLVRDTITPVAFRSQFGIQSDVQIFSYPGKLDNGGEAVTLRAPDEPVQTGANAGEVAYIIIDRVEYSDNAPWPAEADGLGYSLERINANAYGNDVINWKKSTSMGGTPGTADLEPVDPPSNADNDQDGMPDSWELTYFNSTNHPNGNPEDDFDGDGHNNLEEYITGTVPNDPGSQFTAVLSTVDNEGGTHFSISWNAVSNRLYDILWASRLDEGFQYLAMGIAYPTNTYTDTVHTTEDAGYYDIRVKLEE